MFCSQHHNYPSLTLWLVPLSSKLHPRFVYSFGQLPFPVPRPHSWPQYAIIIDSSRPPHFAATPWRRNKAIKKLLLHINVGIRFYRFSFGLSVLSFYLMTYWLPEDLPGSSSPGTSALTRHDAVSTIPDMVRGDWVLFHPVYQPAELKAVEVCLFYLLPSSPIYDFILIRLGSTSRGKDYLRQTRLWIC